MHTPQTAVRAATGTAFTVPAGEKYVITHIRIQEEAAATGACTVTFSGGVYGSGVNHSVTALAANGGTDYWLRSAFAATDTCTVTLTGTVGVIVDYERYILG